ncbi:hypothetical protein [Deinococcus roseus]|uniref:Uncharacterized protein n=1 Tax=Deinococcus roseus TaxID=392414 RepID=A0ABQ2CYC7_9DEIO|nr:hypothetical protein [Deinococcus roseus]GGJ32582.1 hypothetical protein GCM10008938_18480 [Deinococcus roseus]
MIQLVYVLEILKPSGPIRAHFTQAPRAAMRAASRYHLSGEWQGRPDDGNVVSELWSEGQLLARVVKETVEYS